jgi:uncharacterized protein (DUF1330 family)
MSVFLIATLNIHDRSAYAEYEAGFMEIFTQHEGELMAVDEAPTVLEGEWPYSRTVLIRFPNTDSLNRWYTSDAYQGLVRHRFAASTGNAIVIKALSNPPGARDG